MTKTVQIPVEDVRGIAFYSLTIDDKRGIASVYSYITSGTETLNIPRKKAPKSYALMKQLIETLTEEKSKLEEGVVKKRKKYAEIEKLRSKKITDSLNLRKESWPSLLCQDVKDV